MIRRDVNIGLALGVIVAATGSAAGQTHGVTLDPPASEYTGLQTITVQWNPAHFTSGTVWLQLVSNVVSNAAAACPVEVDSAAVLSVERFTSTGQYSWHIPNANYQSGNYRVLVLSAAFECPAGIPAGTEWESSSAFSLAADLTSELAWEWPPTGLSQMIEVALGARYVIQASHIRGPPAPSEPVIYYSLRLQASVDNFACSPETNCWTQNCGTQFVWLYVGESYNASNQSAWHEWILPTPGSDDVRGCFRNTVTGQYQLYPNADGSGPILMTDPSVTVRIVMGLMNASYGALCFDRHQDGCANSLDGLTDADFYNTDPFRVVNPTDAPTPAPTTSPTSHPSALPTVLPTISPTVSPTVPPTTSPTWSPTTSPTVSPSGSPTASPTALPTASPTTSPTASPTIVPTASPTSSPTIVPTASPTVSPTASPTAFPTASPTVAPTVSPTTSPTVPPTASPTLSPTVSPSVSPSASPTAFPTALPTFRPTAVLAAPTAPPPTTSLAGTETSAQSDTSAGFPWWIIVVLVVLLLICLLIALFVKRRARTKAPVAGTPSASPSYAIDRENVAYSSVPPGAGALSRPGAIQNEIYRSPSSRSGEYRTANIGAVQNETYQVAPGRGLTVANAAYAPLSPENDTLYATSLPPLVNATHDVGSPTRKDAPQSLYNTAAQIRPRDDGAAANEVYMTAEQPIHTANDYSLPAAITDTGALGYSRPEELPGPLASPPHSATSGSPLYATTVNFQPAADNSSDNQDAAVLDMATAGSPLYATTVNFQRAADNNYDNQDAAVLDMATAGSPLYATTVNFQRAADNNYDNQDAAVLDTNSQSAVMAKTVHYVSSDPLYLNHEEGGSPSYMTAKPVESDEYMQSSPVVQTSSVRPVPAPRSKPPTLVDRRRSSGKIMPPVLSIQTSPPSPDPNVAVVPSISAALDEMELSEKSRLTVDYGADPPDSAASIYSQQSNV